MSTDPVRVTPVDPAEQPSLSSVKIALNAKGMAQPEIKLYEGVTATEVERLSQLALDTFNSLLNRLGARANFT